MAIPRALLAFGVGFLMLALVVSAPNAAALNESMDVITLPGFSTTTLGATVTLTTHVFQYGSHADATSLTVSTFARTLTATRTSTGVYETTFTIQATDVYGGYVYVNVGAWIGTLFDYGYAYLQLGPWFALDLTTSATHASPGDTVDVTARFTENGTLLDPNTIVVRASLAVPGAATITQDLTLTHPATGTYVGSFTVPPTLAQEGYLSFNGNAERSGFYAYDGEALVATPAGSRGLRSRIRAPSTRFRSGEPPPPAAFPPDSPGTSILPTPASSSSGTRSPPCTRPGAPYRWARPSTWTETR